MTAKNSEGARDGHRFVDPLAPLDAEHRAAVARLEPRLMGVETRRVFHGQRGDIKLPERDEEDPIVFDIAVAEAASQQSEEAKGRAIVLFVDLIATGESSVAAVSLVSHLLVAGQGEEPTLKADRQAIGAWAAPILYDSAASTLRSALTGSPGTQELSVPLFPPRVRLHSLVRRKRHPE